MEFSWWFFAQIDVGSWWHVFLILTYFGPRMCKHIEIWTCTICNTIGLSKQPMQGQGYKTTWMCPQNCVHVFLVLLLKFYPILRTMQSLRNCNLTKIKHGFSTFTCVRINCDNLFPTQMVLPYQTANSNVSLIIPPHRVRTVKWSACFAASKSLHSIPFTLFLLQHQWTAVSS